MTEALVQAVPGIDLVVLTVPKDMSDQEIDDLGIRVQGDLPGHNVVVVREDVRVSIIRPKESGAPAHR